MFYNLGAWSLFCDVFLSAFSSFAVILWRKRELVAFLMCCGVGIGVQSLFLAVP